MSRAKRLDKKRNVFLSNKKEQGHSGFTGTHFFQLFFYLAIFFGVDRVSRVFGFGEGGVLSLPGANAQTVSTNNSTWPNLLFYIGEDNKFSMPMKDAFGVDGLKFARIESFDGQPAPVSFSHIATSYVMGLSVLDILANQTIIYVANREFGLRILDATDPLNLKLLGTCDTPGQARSLAIDGNFVYVADDFSGLQIIDVKDPVKPKLVGSYSTPGNAYGVKIFKNLAYVANTNFGIQIINVSNETSPKLLNTYSTNPDARNLEIVGSVMYIANGFYGLQILDISNNTFPKFLGSYNTPGSSLGVNIVGNISYVSDNVGLQIIDISNSSNIKIASFYDTKGRASSVIINDEIAYVSDYDDGLQMIDVKNASNPKWLGSYDTAGYAINARASGNMIYVADHTDGLQVINQTMLVMNKNFREKNRGVYTLGLLSTNLKTIFFRVAVSEKVLLRNAKYPDVISVNDYNKSFKSTFFPSDLFSYLGKFFSLSLNLKNVSSIPGWLSFSNHFDQSGYDDGGGFVLDFLVIDNLVYLACATDGFRILDLSDINNIKQLSTLSTGFTGGLFVSGSLAYVSSRGDGLFIVDISNSTNPKVNSIYKPTGYTISCTSVYNNIAYIADFSLMGIQVLNVKNSTNPQWILNYNTSSIVRDIQIIGATAYFASDTAGLQIYDLGNSTNPRLLGSCDTPGSAWGVKVVDGLAYIADGARGLQIIDVKNSSAPIWLSAYDDNSGFAYKLDIYGGIAYVASNNLGLKIIDISNILNPKLLNVYRTGGDATSVKCFKNYLYLGDSVNGLQVFDLSSISYTLAGVPTADVSGNYEFTMVGTNDLGVQSPEVSYSLRVEGAPRVIGSMDPQVAFIGKPFNSAVKQGVFTDPNSDALTYSAVAKTGSWPTWLTFTPSGLFFGEASLPVMVVTLTITASDGNGGTASIDVPITITNAPIVANPLANQLADRNKLFSFTFSASTFVDQDGDAISYVARQASGLPLSSTWISFNPATRTFSGTPSSSVRISVDIEGTETHGGKAHAYFDIIAQHFPVAQKNVTDKLIAIGKPFSYRMPDGLFFDPDGDAMTIRAQDLITGGLPSWLTFSAFNVEFGEFSGTPIASVDVLPMRVIARDSQGAETSVNFNFILDYFPTVNPSYTITNTVVPVGKPWNFTIPSDLFLDKDDTPGNLTVSVSNPSWLTYQNNVLSGTPIQVGVFSIAINATDPKGGSASVFFTVGADQFPEVNPQVQPQVQQVVAPITSAFYYQIPEGLFNYTGTGELTYKANKLVSSNSGRFYLNEYDPMYHFYFHPWREKQQAKFQALASDQLQPLPNWLSFDPVKKLFSGTPAPTDGGNMTVRVTATSPAGGSANVDFVMITTFIPQVQNPIADQIVRAGRVFNISMSNSTFVNRANRDMVVRLLAAQGSALPAWIEFNPAQNQINVAPTLGDVGVFPVVLSAWDGLGMANASFMIKVLANNCPRLAQPIQPCSIPFDSKSVLCSISKDAFVDDDRDPLSFTVKRRGNEALPKWLFFDEKTQTFSANRKLTRSDIHAYNLDVTASDGACSVSGSLDFQISGQTWPWYLFKIVGSTVSGLSFLFGLYKKKHIPWNTFGKAKYYKGIKHAVVVGEDLFVYPLELDKDQIKLIKATQDGKSLTDGNDLPKWLSHNYDKNCLEGKPTDHDIRDLKITVYGQDNKISEQFDLRVTKDYAEDEGLIDQSETRKVNGKKTSSFVTSDQSMFGKGKGQGKKPSVTPGPEVSVDITDELEMQPMGGKMYRGAPVTEL